MASLFTLMTLTVTKANAKETFIYGETDNGLIVSTLNEDGKTLTPKWKYEYQYDKQGRLTEKKAYRWNLQQYVSWIMPNGTNFFVTLSVTANKVFIM